MEELDITENAESGSDLGNFVDAATLRERARTKLSDVNLSGTNVTYQPYAVGYVINWKVKRAKLAELAQVWGSAAAGSILFLIGIMIYLYSDEPGLSTWTIILNCFLIGGAFCFYAFHLMRENYIIYMTTENIDIVRNFIFEKRSTWKFTEIKRVEMQPTGTEEQFGLPFAVFLGNERFQIVGDQLDIKALSMLMKVLHFEVKQKRKKLGKNDGNELTLD